MPGDDFKPVSAFDVSDVGLLPRRLDLLAGEVRSLAEFTRDRVVPMLEQIAEQLDETAVEIADLRRRVANIENPPRAA